MRAAGSAAVRAAGSAPSSAAVRAPSSVAVRAAGSAPSSAAVRAPSSVAVRAASSAAVRAAGNAAGSAAARRRELGLPRRALEGGGAVSAGGLAGTANKAWQSRLSSASRAGPVKRRARQGVRALIAPSRAAVPPLAKVGPSTARAKHSWAHGMRRSGVSRARRSQPCCCCSAKCNGAATPRAYALCCAGVPAGVLCRRPRAQLDRPPVLQPLVRPMARAAIPLCLPGTACARPLLLGQLPCHPCTQKGPCTGGVGVPRPT